MVDDINPALPIMMNIPSFLQFRAIKVMQDLYHQPYHELCQAQEVLTSQRLQYPLIQEYSLKNHIRL